MKNIIKEMLKDTASGLSAAVKIILSACLMTGIFYGSYTYLDGVFEYSGIYDGTEFHSLPEDSMDIIVLGSSHAQYSYVPSFVYQDTGLYSYVLGSACQPFCVSYEMLKEALKTQSPELVVMEVFTGTPLRKSCEGDSCYVTAAYQMTGDEKYETLNYLDEEKAKSYYNTFINDHNEWKNMESLSELLPKEKNKGYGSDFGYVYNSFVSAENYWYPNWYESEPQEVELDELDVKSLNNILSLCKENDTELLLYIVPCDSISEEDQAYRYKIWEWADINGVKYQDYVTLATTIDYRMCVHSDGAHSFVNGASLICTHLSDFINENYLFDSHDYNKEVEDKLIVSDINYAVSAVDSECNPLIYLKRINGYKGTTLIRYTKGKQYVDSEITEIIHQICGNENFNPSMNYFAIVQDGKTLIDSYEPIITSLENGEEFEINDEMIIHGTDVIEYADPFTLIVFNDDFTAKAIRHIESVTPAWWNCGKNYWERGYDMYYSLTSK